MSARSCSPSGDRRRTDARGPCPPEVNDGGRPVTVPPMTTGDIQQAQVGEFELEYETFGSRADPPLLLVMGLGDADDPLARRFCRAARRPRLLRRPLRQPRHRHVDASSTTPASRTSSAAIRRRPAVRAPYTLDDMADDTVGLMERLDIPRAHVVGASMGGMIAQTLACRHPDRVLTLTSIMSTTGDRPAAGAPADAAMEVLLPPPPTTARSASSARCTSGASSAAPASSSTRPTSATAPDAPSTAALAGRRGPPARRHPRLRQPHRAPRLRHRADASSSTATPTRWCRRAAAAPPRRR